MKVGIFGGSFNPIHIGHTQLGQCLVRNGYVDELWFLVSPLNPLKQDDINLLDDQARLHMAHLAVEGREGLRVCELEMHLPRPSYMVRTLEELRRIHPHHEFLLVIGADNWLRFAQWRDSDEILRFHSILIYPRPGYNIDTSTLPANVRLVSTPLYPISSTEIRQAIARGHYHGRGLTPKVWKEIKLNRYYL